MNLPRVWAGVPRIRIKEVDWLHDRGAPNLIIRATTPSPDCGTPCRQGCFMERGVR